MKIISDINHQTLPPSVATIGFFDGVHRGHRFLINQVKEVAAKDGLYSALITFPVHPRQVIQTAYRPQLLSSPTEKLELLETMQVDYCFLLPFTQELSLFSAREFMQLLRNKFNIHTLVIGYDHRFGHNRSENFEDYCRYGEELNIYIVRARAYTDKEGKIPTANLQVDCSDKLIPSEGVYAVYVYVEGKKWAGMLNIGHRPTINNGNNLSIEVNILNFSENIYHKEMRIEFVKYLRPEEKYDTIDALIAQMHKDREKTARILL